MSSKEPRNGGEGGGGKEGVWGGEKEDQEQLFTCVIDTAAWHIFSPLGVTLFCMICIVWMCVCTCV